MGLKLIIFDLDGTLAESKSRMDSEMAGLLRKLLEKKYVAVISGGAYSQYEKQFLASLDCPESLLGKLYLFPTCSTAFYLYEGEWKCFYRQKLPEEDRRKIIAAFDKAFADAKFDKPRKTFGELIEDRETQITFSALGQQAPAELKKQWDPDGAKRQKIKAELEKYIPEYEIRIGGSTSIDVTQKGIDKTYGIRQIKKHLGFSREEMLFVGDALFEGGNDYPIKATGVECVSTSGPEETKKIISGLLQ